MNFVKASIFQVIILAVFAICLHVDAFAQRKDSPLYGATVTIGVGPKVNWPPYEYLVGDGQDEHVEGFVVDVLSELLLDYNVNIKFSFYPWKRCLHYLVDGEYIQMLLPTSLNPERMNKYYYTDYLYEVSPAYFYLNSNRKRMKPIYDASDLYDLGVICGERGYNYEGFGIDNSRIDRNASDLNALIGKVKDKRCTVALARFEVVAASSLTGETLLSNDVGFGYVPNVDKERFHFLVTKNAPFSKELINVINEGVWKMRKSGRLMEIMEKYIRAYRK